MRRLIALTVLVLGPPLIVVAQAPGTQPASQPVKLTPDVERVFKYIPDDTNLVVVVPGLDQLVTGLAAFGKALGVKELASVSVSDLLEEHLGENGAAISASGPLVLALSANSEDPLAIAAVTNTASWKSSAKPSDLPSEAQLFEFGDDRYVAVSKDNVAIVAREKGDLQRALKATGQFSRRLVAHSGGLLGRRQVVLYVEVPAWRTIIDQKLDAAVTTEGLASAVGGADPETALQLWKWAFDQAKKAVLDVETYGAAVRIDGQGVFIEQRAAVKADSELGRRLKGVQRSKRDLLRGLPRGGAISLAWEWEEPPGTVGFQEALVKAMLRMGSLKEKLGSEKLEAALSKSVEVYRNLNGASSVIAPIPDGKGLLISGLQLTKDGPEVQRGMRAIMEIYPCLMNCWGTLPSATVQCGSEKIGEVAVNVYHFSFGTDDPQLQPMMQAFYGVDPALFMAPHPEGVVYAMGAQDSARQALTDLLNGKPAALRQDPRVAALFETLTPEPQVCVLVDVPQFFKLVSVMLQQVGVPVPPLPGGDKPQPLAGFSLYIEPEALRAELFVPAEPIKALKDALTGERGGGEY